MKNLSIRFFQFFLIAILTVFSPVGVEQFYAQPDPDNTVRPDADGCNCEYEIYTAWPSIYPTGSTVMASDFFSQVALGGKIKKVMHRCFVIDFILVFDMPYLLLDDVHFSMKPGSAMIVNPGAKVIFYASGANPPPGIGNLGGTSIRGCDNWQGMTVLEGGILEMNGGQLGSPGQPGSPAVFVEDAFAAITLEDGSISSIAGVEFSDNIYV